MKLWIDDLRPAPEGYVWLKSVNEAKEWIEWIEEILNELQSNLSFRHSYHEERQKMFIENIQEQIAFFKITIIDIDHDAGDYADDGGDYIRLLDWMEETGRNYPVKLHTMNPVGFEKMKMIIEKNGWDKI